MTRLSGCGAPGKVSCAVLALALVIALTPPASASGVPVDAISSLNWSGYALTGSAFTGVTGTFKVPVPLRSGPCLEETAVWVGVDGVSNHDLLQAGISESGFALPSGTAPAYWPAPTVLCPGRVQVYAWWEDLPSTTVRVDLPVKVGDIVTVSLFKMSPGWWALVVHDLTAERSFLMAQPYAGPETSVEWVVEAPQVMGVVSEPVPFSTVEFRDLSAHGQWRDLERFSCDSNRHFASEPDVVATTAQLLQTGFAVHWAP